MSKPKGYKISHQSLNFLHQNQLEKNQLDCRNSNIYSNIYPIKFDNKHQQLLKESYSSGK